MTAGTHLDPLWRTLGKSPVLSLPRARMRQQLGDAAVAWLELSRVVLQAPLLAGEPYPCVMGGSGDCDMHLVQEEGLVAVCGLEPADCDDELIPEADAWQLEVSPERLIPVIQDGLQLFQRPVSRDGLFFLGERDFGEHRMSFALVPQPARLDRRWFEAAEREDAERILVLLVFHRDHRPAGAPRQLGRLRIVWMALSDALPTETGLTFDLTDLWLTYAPHLATGPDLWPRYAVVADPARQRFWYGGCELGLATQGRLRRLLLALLERPGEPISNDELYRRVWPNQAPKNVSDMLRLEQSLRQAKKDLLDLIRSLELPDGVNREPIQLQKALQDSEGGYYLDLPPERVWWVSREPGPRGT